MAPADTLSRRDSIDTSSDNINTAICLEPVVIGALDLALTRHIASSSTSDPLVLHALENLCADSPLFPCSSIKDWLFEDGHLYFKGWMYILLDAHHTLISSLHSSSTLGHAGRFCTKTFLKRDFWWPGLATYVNKFIKGCAVCQQNKVNTHPVCPPLNPIPTLSSLPFKQLSVDLITDLPEVRRLDSILVVVNHGLMKGVIIIPCSKTIDAAGVGRLFFTNIFKCFGLHDSLISDRGPQFASALAKELARLLQYNIKLSTTYHPQTDGQTECVNQEVETYLHIFCTNQPRSWPDLLPTTEFQHNSAPHHSTKVSPFSLMMGYEPRAYPSIGKTFLPVLENHLSILDEARKEALAAHETARRIMKERITSTFSLWKVRDKVWLEATNLRLQYPSRKLAPRHLGPFEISQVLSPIVYHLQLPPTWKIHNVFHASLLSPYKQTDTHGPNFSTLPPDLISSEKEYEVETIISHKGSPGQRKYLTTWKGYLSSENTWEPEVNLQHAPKILKDYKQIHALNRLKTTPCLTPADEDNKNPQRTPNPPSTGLTSPGNLVSLFTSLISSIAANSTWPTPEPTLASVERKVVPSITNIPGQGISP